MVLSKMQRLKVILLLSGYLYVVLTHLQYIEPPHRVVTNQAFISDNIVPKAHDKSGHVILIVKKIYKTVINRNLFDENNKASQHLYATKLLFNNTLAPNAKVKLPRYSTPLAALPAKRCFYLRI
jgi:hypothetical protein